jgi:hypothetical protein
MTLETQDQIKVLHTVGETATILACHTKTVRKLLDLCELQRVDLNRHAVRVSGASIRAFLERGGSAS